MTAEADARVAAQLRFFARGWRVFELGDDGPVLLWERATGTFLQVPRFVVTALGHSEAHHLQAALREVGMR